MKLIISSRYAFLGGGVGGVAYFLLFILELNILMKFFFLKEKIRKLT